MSLDLRDIERGVGADLLRRPIVARVINAAILRFYIETMNNIDEDDDNDEQTILQQQQGWVKPLLAAGTFVITHIFLLLGLAETLVWLVLAIVFRIVKAPKIYAFEKLILDVWVLFSRSSVRCVEKIIRLQSRTGEGGLQRLSASRQGIGSLVITTITCEESLTRDTLALLRLLRYMNKNTIAFWKDDYVVMVGANWDIVEAVCNVGMTMKPAVIDLGWHKDVVEQTNFKISVKFARESLPSRETCIKSISRKLVVAEVVADANTSNLELIVQCMDQFAAVCEAAERGRRMFNGKRLSIYGVGILISIALIIRYEGLPGLVKPSADVLTLAVGAYTLWMTLGKSAALGETEEEATLEVTSRKNLLMAFHGLATIDTNVINTCWVPEIFREVTDEIPEGPEVDGSISTVEAAICLSIFQHFGHLVKWKGRKLLLDVYKISGSGLGHIVSVDRIRNINALDYAGHSLLVERLGYS